MHADRGVGGTGAAGGKGDAGPSGHGAVRRRHERRAAFLPADHGLDGVVAALVMQGIEHGEEAFARHGENTVAALNAELVDKDLAAGAGHKGLRWFTVGHTVLMRFRLPPQAARHGARTGLRKKSDESCDPE